MNTPSSLIKPAGLFFILLLPLLVFSQNFSESPLVTRENAQALKSLYGDVSFKWDLRQQQIQTFGNARLAETDLADTLLTLRFMGFSSTGEPIYYQTYNLFAAQSINTHRLWTGGSSELDLDGTGITLRVWDGGSIRHTHQEFGDRTTQMDTGGFMSGHATHVAGTMVAAGVVPTAKGMAPDALLHSYYFENDEEEMIEAAADGALLSNHSYGRPTGWVFHTNQWWWYGDTRISEIEDYKFGFYSDETRIRDEITYLAPYYLQVHAAGNDRLDIGPAEGEEHNVYDHDIEQWVKSTISRMRDGGDEGLDCISTLVLGKNVLTIGSVADASDYEGPESVLLSEFSSTGPTDDGRIKPDLVAKGQGLLSTWVDTNTSYAGLTGTSMAAPTITGSLGLLQQLNHRLYGSYLRASTIKALAIHTAREAGLNPGPDYQHGWGLADIEAAAEILPEKDNTTIIQERNLVQNTVPTYSRTVYSTGTQPLVATLVWTDVPADTPEPALNDRTPILVNDLDLRVTRISDGEIFYPWKLDPDNPMAPAMTGDNLVDNVEKIEILLPEPGQYFVEVSHKGDIVDPVNPTNKRQSFSLIISGIAERAVDLAVTDANVLASGCDFTDQTPAFIRVENKGQQDAQNVVVNYTVLDQDNVIVTEDSSTIELLEAGLSTELDVILDLSQGFEFTFTATVNYPGDQLPSNNTFTRELISDSWMVSNEPYHTSFESIVYIEEIGWQTINNNDDNAGWMLRIADGPNQFASDGANSMRYGILNPADDGVEVDVQADDWLISTCLYLVPDEIYRLSFDYRVWNADFSENMRVVMGQIPDPELMNTEIVDINNFSNEEFITSMEQFTVEEEGNYFFAFHVYSDPDHRFIYLDNVFVERMVFADLTPTTIDVLAGGCDFSAETPVSVGFMNLGLDSQQNFDVQLNVTHLNSETTDSYFLSYSEELNPNEENELIFQVDMSLYGEYEIKAITLLEGDEKPENDTLTIHVINSLVDLESNSFFTNFDDINGLDEINWAINNVNDDGYSWRFYNVPGQANSPPHSINYYRSDQGGIENDWLVTNCLRMEEGETYRINFYTSTQGTGDEDEYRIFLMSGTEPDDTLSQFGYVYLDTYDYVEEEFTIQAPYTGIFHIGFFVDTNIANSVQFFVDDVTIEKVSERDAAMRDVIQEVYGCNSFTDETPIKVVYKNRGTLLLEDATVEVTVTDEDENSVVYSQTIPTALELGQKDTLSFEVDLSQLNSIYTITAKIISDNDEYPSNDEISVFIRNTTVDLTQGHEYFNDFELVHIDGGNALVDPKLGWWYENTNDDFYSDGNPITWALRKTSSFAYSGEVSMRAGRSTENPADDWLFSNCLIMQEGENYLLNFYYTGRTTSATEKMGVYLGTDQTSATMEELLWDETFSTGINYQKATVTFNPPADGTYYIGFYHYSDADQGWIYLDDFSIRSNYNLDVALDSIIVLAESCEFSDQTPLRISVKNTGNDAFEHPVTMSYSIVDPSGNIAATGEETIEQTMAVNDVVYYDFFIDMRIYGEYTIEASVSLPDEISEPMTDNNHLTLNVRNISMFPNVEDVYLTFEEYESMGETGFTAMDINNDNFTWDLGTSFTNFSYSGKKVFYYSFSASNDADDWLFSSCANLEAGTVYNISYWYRVYSGDYPENMKFGVASEPHPDAVIEYLDVKEEMDNYNYRRVTYAFTVPEDGQYYFAWHAFSPKYHRFMFMDDFALRIASDVDGSIYSISADVESCDFTEETPMIAVVKNLGSQELPAGSLDINISSPFGSQDITMNTPAIPVLGHAEVGFEASITGQARFDFDYNLQIPDDEIPGNNQGTFRIFGTRVDLTQPGDWFIQDFETIFALREIDWSIHNLNNDNRYWGLRVNDPPLAHSGHNYLVYFTGNQTQAGNDWVISGCYELNSELKYKAAYFYRLGSGSHNLRIAAGLLPEASAMTNIIWEETQVTTPEDQPYMPIGDTFEVDEGGRFYFGIQQFSPANQGSSLADDLVIIAQPQILPFEGPMETGMEITIEALGSDSLRWFADEELTQIIGEGTSLTITVDTDYTMTVYAAEYVYGVMGPADSILIGPGVGFDDVDDQMTLNVYPNPAGDYLKLELPFRGEEKFGLKLSNMMGEIVKSEIYTYSGELTLDVSGLAPGSYIISVQTRDKKLQGRFVKF